MLEWVGVVDNVFDPDAVGVEDRVLDIVELSVLE